MPSPSKTLKLFSWVMGTVLLGVILFLGTRREPEPVVPDFGSIQEVALKKQTFFEYLTPLVAAENAAIAHERRDLDRLRQQLMAQAPLSARDQKLLAGLGVKYRVPERDELSAAHLAQALRSRVDVVPLGLALAQAANESAWGTSRFARTQKNFFGLWCFTEGCGVKPRRAAADSRHWVAAFDSVQAGVAYYLLTLNSHPAYEDLRALRAVLRSGEGSVTGQRLAEGLMRYSERGPAYVEEIRAMIRINALDAL